MFCILKIKIYPAYVSKNNPNRENQVILLIISNGKMHVAKSEGCEAMSEGTSQWHYLTVK